MSDESEAKRQKELPGQDRQEVDQEDNQQANQIDQHYSTVEVEILLPFTRSLVNYLLFDQTNTLYVSLKATQPPVEEKQEANPNKDGSPNNGDDNQQNPQPEEEMVGAYENVASQNKDNTESSSEEDS